MSYCRWSSDNWQCDLYCYEDCYGGITTYMASNRIVGDIPEVPDILTTEPEVFVKAYKKQLNWLEKAEREPIGLPYDGQRFNDRTYKSFLERLLHLRETGYNFPDYVIERVKEQIKDGGP